MGPHTFGSPSVHRALWLCLVMVGLRKTLDSCEGKQSEQGREFRRAFDPAKMFAALLTGIGDKDASCQLPSNRF
jgi:hypothetical protein